MSSEKRTNEMTDVEAAQKKLLQNLVISALILT